MTDTMGRMHSDAQFAGSSLHILMRDTPFGVSLFFLMWIRPFCHADTFARLVTTYMVWRLSC